MSLPTLGDLLVGYRGELLGYVSRHAGRLLRHESADDVVQAVHLRVLGQKAGFEYRGRDAFLGWVRTVARSYMADRHAHWAALRRRPARLVRLVGAGDATNSSMNDRSAAAEPAGTATGPSTFASRREQVDVAVRALGLLPDRDRDLVRWTCEDVPVEEQARRLGISEAAADRARRRAVERLRKLHAVIAGG